LTVLSHLCNLQGNVNPDDTVTSNPVAPDRGSPPVNVNATKRGPICEFLDHLLSELRQLDQRCSQLEILLHDFAIRYATATSEPIDPRS
jgi:hypothetical protein